jgi:predicted PurR-regulated permease PerM
VSDTVVTRFNPSKDVNRLLTVVVGVVAICTLYFARIVLIPFALALLFTFILTPVVKLLERLHFGRILSAIVVLALCIVMCGVIGWSVTKQLSDIFDQLPSYQSNIKAKVQSFHWSSSHTLHSASETMTEISKELGAPPPSDGTQPNHSKSSRSPAPAQPLPVQVVTSPALPVESLQSVLELLARVLIVVAFTIFMLIRREDLRNRLISLSGGANLHLITQALDDASARVSRYLLLQFLVNTCYGIVISVCLHFMGIPGAVLWGVVAGVLRFLPYVGPPLGAVMPLLLSMAVFNGWSKPLLLLGLFVIAELTVSNLVEPILYGAHTGISSLAILVSAVFWSALWGPIGLLLSTPLTVCLLVVGRHVPQLGFLHILLGDEPPLTPDSRFYQRLLAMDHEEAREVLQKCLNEMPLEDLYENVMIPALALAEQDRHQNLLQDENKKFISQSTRDLIDELWDPLENQRGSDAKKSDEAKDTSALSLSLQPAPAPPPCQSRNVLCVPVRDEADEIVGTMLAQLLQRAGHRAECLPLESAERMLAQIPNYKPDIVCISALPPFAIPTVRDLYTKMRGQAPEQKIIVGLWHFSGDPAQLVRRLGLKEGASAFTTLTEIIQEIQRLSTPNAPPNERSNAPPNEGPTESPDEATDETTLRIGPGRFT